LPETLSILAGVLLGKTSLNSLYGLLGACRKLCHSFGYPDSADIRLAAAPNE
jgi:hypothetical protein